eukprot:3411101-Rhodomonas_salina.2
MPGFFKPGKALFDSDNHDARHVALQRRGAAGCSSRESNKDSSSWPRRGVALGGHGPTSSLFKLRFHNLFVPGLG